MRIQVNTLVNAPIEHVWHCYTTPEHIKQWNAASEDWHTTAATVDLRVGGQFSSRMEAKDGSFGFDFAGTYTQIIPYKLIEYSFGERNACVQFSADAQGVLVSVEFDAEETHSIEQQREGWQAILENFSRHVMTHKNV
ncbi:MAG: SRPBCC domain-containing protein [Marinagarivorans sp.]